MESIYFWRLNKKIKVKILMQSKIHYWWKLNILYIVDNPIVIHIPVAIVRPFIQHHDDDDDAHSMIDLMNQCFKHKLFRVNDEVAWW